MDCEAGRNPVWSGRMDVSGYRIAAGRDTKACPLGADSWEKEIDL